MRSGLFDLYKAASEKEKKRGTGLNFDFAKAKIKRELWDYSDMPPSIEKEILDKVKAEIASGNLEYMIFSPDELSRLESLGWKSGGGEDGEKSIFHHFGDEDRFWIGASVIVGRISGADFSYVKDWMSSVEGDEYKGKIFGTFFPGCKDLKQSREEFRSEISSAFPYLKALSDRWHAEKNIEKEEVVEDDGAEAKITEDKTGKYLDTDPANEVFSFPNGFKIRYIPAAGEMEPWEGDEKTSHDRVVEGNKMSICLGAKSRLYQNNSEGKIYSLRDSSNKPLVTMRLSEGLIYEIRGKMNSSDFSLEAADCVLKFLDSLSLNAFSGSNDGYGLFKKMSEKEVAERFYLICNELRSADIFKDGLIFRTALHKNKFIMGDKEKAEMLISAMESLLSYTYNNETALIYLKEGFDKLEGFEKLKGMALNRSKDIDPIIFFKEGLDSNPELTYLVPIKEGELGQKRIRILNKLLKYDDEDFEQFKKNPNDLSYIFEIEDFFSAGCHKLPEASELALKIEPELDSNSFFDLKLHLSPLFLERAKERLRESSFDSIYKMLLYLGFDLFDGQGLEDLKEIALEKAEQNVYDIFYKYTDEEEYKWNNPLFIDAAINLEPELTNDQFFHFGLNTSPVFSKRMLKRVSETEDDASFLNIYFSYLQGKKEIEPILRERIKSLIKSGIDVYNHRILYFENAGKIDPLFVKILREEVRNKNSFSGENPFFKSPYFAYNLSSPLLKKIVLEKIILESKNMIEAAKQYFRGDLDYRDIENILSTMQVSCELRWLDKTPEIKAEFLKVLKRAYPSYNFDSSEESANKSIEPALASLASSLVKLGFDDIAAKILNIDLEN